MTPTISLKESQALGNTPHAAIRRVLPKRNGNEILRFPADWKKHGKAAGPIRNKQMAEAGDILCAFWDGKSRGTRNMIATARELGLEVHVFTY